MKLHEASYTSAADAKKINNTKEFLVELNSEIVNSEDITDECFKNIAAVNNIDMMQVSKITRESDIDNEGTIFKMFDKDKNFLGKISIEIPFSEKKLHMKISKFKVAALSAFKYFVFDEKYETQFDATIKAVKSIRKNGDKEVFIINHNGNLTVLHESEADVKNEVTIIIENRETGKWVAVS